MIDDDKKNVARKPEKIHNKVRYKTPGKVKDKKEMLKKCEYKVR